MLNDYIPLVPKFNYGLQYKKVKHEHKSRGAHDKVNNQHFFFRHDYYDLSSIGLPCRLCTQPILLRSPPPPRPRVPSGIFCVVIT